MNICENKTKDYRTKYLLKNTCIFFLGNLGTKMIAFFLVPLYTFVFSTKEYGIIDLISTINLIAIPIITLNIVESVMRFALDKDADNRRITQIGWVFLIFGTIIAVALIPVFNHIVHNISQALLSYLYVVSSASSQLWLCDLRGKELLTKYSIGNVLNTLMVLVFSILFLIFLKIGFSGFFISYILSNAITTLYAMIAGRGYKSISIRDVDSNLMKEMLKYSVVLIPNSFMWWIMNSSDRIMVTEMIGAEANGIYAVAYKLPTIIIILASVFNQAWSYSAIKESGSTDEIEYNNYIFKILISTVMIAGIVVVSFAKPFMCLYVTENFFPAWKYISFLTIGCVYLTLATFMATSYTVHKDSMGYLFSGTFGAVLNVILNFVFIPLAGVYGAAISTGISYVSVFVFRLIHTKKYITYSVKNYGFILGSLLLFSASLLMYINSKWGSIIQMIIVVVTIILYYPVWYPLIRKVLFNWKKKTNGV